MKENKLNILIHLILLISLTACTEKVSEVLQDTTCSAPCWHNIEVGRTDFDQTINLLNQVPELEPSSIRRGKEGISAGFQNSKELSLQIFFNEEKAAAIRFSYEEDIPLSDAIKKFGEPKYLYPSAIKGDPLVYLTVQFLYPDEGICLLHEHRGLIFQIPKIYGITRATNITQVYYVDPALPNGQIDYGCFTGGNENDLNSEKQDWKGFSDYAIP